MIGARMLSHFSQMGFSQMGMLPSEDKESFSGHRTKEGAHLE